MYSAYQPDTSTALAWDGRQAALATATLEANTTRPLGTDASGNIVLKATVEDYLPPSIELTGDMTAAGLIGQTLNGVSMPTPAASQTGVFIRRETYTSSTASLGAHDIAFPTGTGWDNFVSGSVWYKDSIAGVWRMALQKGYDNSTNDNEWTLCPVPDTGTTGWVMRYHSNLNANSEVRMVAYFRCT